MHVCISTYMCIYIYIYTYAYMYIYIYIHMWNPTSYPHPQPQDFPRRKITLNNTGQLRKAWLQELGGGDKLLATGV